MVVISEKLHAAEKVWQKQTNQQQEKKEKTTFDFPLWHLICRFGYFSFKILNKNNMHWQQMWLQAKRNNSVSYVLRKELKCHPQNLAISKTNRIVHVR